MKKRLISLMIISMMMLGFVPQAFAATENFNGSQIVVTNKKTGERLVQEHNDPYQYTKGAMCYGYLPHTNETLYMKPGGNSGTDEYFGATMAGKYIVYKDMNFTRVPRSIDFYYCTDVNVQSVSIYKDSYSNSNLIATIPVTRTGTWDTPVKVSMDLESAKAAMCSGEIDILVCPNSDSINIYGFQFQWEYETITGPSLTQPVSAAQIGAEATIARDKNQNETRNAQLMLAEYNANGAMVNLTKSSPQGIANGTTIFDINEFSKNTNTTGLGAFLWYSDDTPVKAAAFDSLSVPSGTPSVKKIDAVADNGYVTISGTGVNNESTIIAIVPQNYSNQTPLYSQTMYQVYQTEVTNGTYYYKFKMPTSVPTGTYKAIIKGATNNESVDFEYTSPNEIYQVLLILSQNTDVDTVASTIAANADLFGIEAKMFNNMQTTAKTNINTKVKAFFGQNPLSETGNYSLWTSGLKAVIAPEAIVSYIKNGNDVLTAIDYINRYNVELGISSNPKYTTYFKDDYRPFIVKTIAANINNADNFNSVFSDAVVIGCFNASQTWGYADEALKAFINDIPQISSADYAKYNKLINSAKKDMMNEFVNKNFTSISAIAQLFNSQISIYATPENMTSSTHKIEQSKVSYEEEFVVETRHEIVAEQENNQGNGTVAIIRPFQDLDSVPWAKESINFMRMMGYVNGKSDTTFAPDDNITREEFAVIAVRTFGIGTADVSNIRFNDVDKNAWYSPYIAAAVENGIIQGIDAYTFGVGQNITREQIAAILQRTTKTIGKSIVPQKTAIGFADYNYISDYAYDAVYELAAANIINGTGNDRFSPRKHATRAEAVVMIHRLYENIK